MKIIKHILIFFFCITLTSCISDTIEPTQPCKEDTKPATVVYSITLNEEISELDSLESIIVPVNTSFPGTGGISGGSGPETMAPYIPCIAKVTNLGNHQTVWKYGVGDNRVPDYLCGTSLADATISTLYKVSIIYDRVDGYYIDSHSGTDSGWLPIYINNPQTPFQNMNSGDDNIKCTHTCLI